MNITELPPPDLRIRVEQYSERTEGLHLSTIIQDMLIRMEPERYNYDEPGWANFHIGLVYERALEMAWLDKERVVRPELIRPGEIRYRGVYRTVDKLTGLVTEVPYTIYITPDAYDTAFGRPEEYKCTKKSCRQSIKDKKFAHYWWQLKGQMKVTGSTSGVLNILHINGNYNWSGKLADGSPDPDTGYVIKPWLGEFTQLEIEENWMMLIGHAYRHGMLEAA